MGDIINRVTRGDLTEMVRHEQIVERAGGGRSDDIGVKGVSGPGRGTS